MSAKPVCFLLMSRLLSRKEFIVPAQSRTRVGITSFGYFSHLFVITIQLNEEEIAMKDIQQCTISQAVMSKQANKNCTTAFEVLLNANNRSVFRVLTSMLLVYIYQSKRSNIVNYSVYIYQSK
jgi:hypothetical protein